MKITLPNLYPAPDRLTSAALPQVLVALKELVERIHVPKDHTESTIDLQGSFFVEQAIAALKDAGATVSGE
jgi:hypothetical protein